MITITNRILAEAPGFTHPQIKRWVVAFLEADKASGQHSGIPRTYSFEQAVMIFLGGYLVRDLKFTLSEVRQILNDIYKWLKKKGWTISKWVNFRKSKLSGEYVAEPDYPWLDLFIDIGVGSDGSFFYISKIICEKALIKEPNLWKELYEIEYFGKLSPISIVPLRSINLKATVDTLATLIAKRVNE